jgi:hypothetical protein
LRPRRIAIVSSTDGSLTSTFWKRRSSAASFSMYLRYSSSVGRADAVQLAARERGLEHVAGIHRALGLARADHRVQLVDEQDHAAFLLREIVEHALEPLLELAAELGAGDQRAHVEREDALVAQALRHLAIDDALRQTLDDRRLADAGLADQHGVVFRAALQHLHGAADLVIATDHGVDLALRRRSVRSIVYFSSALPALLGIRVVDLLAAANLVDAFSSAPLTTPTSRSSLPSEPLSSSAAST